MKPEMMQLVNDFADHTAAADAAKDADEANEHFETVYTSFVQLVDKFGNEGREALTSLFHHNRPGVRCMAAAFLLRYKHEESMAVLKELTKERGLVALEAKQSMKNWETGHWELDPEPDAEQT